MNKTAMYMTVDEAAEIWKVRPERVIYTCDCGGIGGAAKLSGQWIIPASIPRPVIKYTPPKRVESAVGNEKRTSKQQAIINAFKGDAIPFSVSEHIYGKTTYTVVSCYSKGAKRTMAEIKASWFLRCLERAGYIRLSASEHDELLKSVRDDEIRNQPSFSEYLIKIERALVKMEFSEEDIAMLLDKYAMVYKPLS